MFDMTVSEYHSPFNLGVLYRRSLLHDDSGTVQFASSTDKYSTVSIEKIHVATGPDSSSTSVCQPLFFKTKEHRPWCSPLPVGGS